MKVAKRTTSTQHEQCEQQSTIESGTETRKTDVAGAIAHACANACAHICAYDAHTEVTIPR